MIHHDELSWSIMIHNDKSAWFVMMNHHDASLRWIIMMHRHDVSSVALRGEMQHDDDSSWWIVMIHHECMTFHDTSWWIIVTHHNEESWWFVMMNHCVALEGFLSGLSWAFLPWAPSIGAKHVFMVPTPFLQDDVFNSCNYQFDRPVTKTGWRAGPFQGVPWTSICCYINGLHKQYILVDTIFNYILSFWTSRSMS